MLINIEHLNKFIFKFPNKQIQQNLNNYSIFSIILIGLCLKIQVNRNLLLLL